MSAGDGALEWMSAVELAEAQPVGWLPGLTPWPVLQLTKVRPSPAALPRPKTTA